MTSEEFDYPRMTYSILNEDGTTTVLIEGEEPVTIEPYINEDIEYVDKS